MSSSRFEIDREEGKLLGVCAGLANRAGIDATIVRIALVAATLLGAWPWSVIAYLALALIGRPSRRPAYGAVPRDPDPSERMRSHDLRMQAIETYAAGSNGSLAREIEELR